MKNTTYVQCFYCEDVLKRPQGRAAHIRKAHPGAPYQPTPEQIAKYKATLSPGAGAPLPVTAPPPQAGPLTPREHLVAAMSEIKHQLEATRRQIPDLETQLQGLRNSQSCTEQELKALETALTTIDGSGRQRAETAASAGGSRG